MGADLFESYAGAIIGTMVLGLGLNAGAGPILLPLLIAAGGIICSIIGTAFVKAKEGATTNQIQHALDFGAFGAAGVMAIATFGLANAVWPEGVTLAGKEITATSVGIATVIGLVIGVLVGMITSYYCSISPPGRPARTLISCLRTVACG